jgi:hypothetical protein
MKKNRQLTKKVLKALFVVQEKQEIDVLNRKHTKIRLNPFNPLTYLFMLGLVLVGIILFGIYGVFNEVDLKKPFNYR